MLKLLVYKFGKLFFYNSKKTKSKKSMSALQKKRDEFRRQIRRKYLDKFFQERRKQFKECQVNLQVLAQVDQIFSELESQLISKRKSYNYEYRTNFVNISKCFQKLKSIAPYDYEKVFTKYMTQKKASQRIIALLNDLIQNQVSSDEEQSNQYEEKLKYATSVRDYTIVEILKFFDTLTLTIIEPDTLLAVIDSVFNLFTDDVLWDSNDTFACLRYTLSILSKLLEDSKNEKIFDHFSNKGIGNQIMKLIDRIKKIELPLQVHNNLLQVINNYLACCLAFSQTNSSKVGQVTIQTSEVNQKEFILFYCVYFIDKRQSSLYPTVFSCISKLLEIHEFLINSLKDEYLALVCDLIVDEKRDTQVESLILLNDLTYHSQTCIDVLLKDGYLLNMLNKRLLLQKNTQDKHVAPSVQKIAYIICNCLLTQKPKLKKLCLQHYIWEEIFESFHPSKKLFPLIMTMAYFLEANGHKNFQKYFRPFAETIRNFDWETCSYSESIREAIMRTFYNAQQWQEHQYVQFLRILNDEGLLKMVEDLVDPDELSKIKGISIQ